jgi:hypothetical protein
VCARLAGAMQRIRFDHNPVERRASIRGYIWDGREELWIKPGEQLPDVGDLF